MRTFPLCIRSLLLVLSLLFGRALSAQNTYTSHDLPQLYYLLAWNAPQSRWDSLYRVVSTYDVNGRLITQYTDGYGNNGFGPFLRKEIDYSPSGDTVTVTRSVDLGAGFSPDSRKVNVYDSLGRTLLDLDLQWGSSLWDTTSSTSFQYFPDLSGRLSSILIMDYHVATHQWDTTSATTFLYGTDPTPNVVLYDNYNNGYWNPVFRDEDLDWQNFNKFKLKHYRRQFWSGSAFEDYQLTDCSFGPYDFRRCTTDRRVNNAWIPYRRDKAEQDSFGTVTQDGLEEYDGTSWDISSWARYTHTYVGGQLAETISEVWNSNTQSLQPYLKYVYFDFAVESPEYADAQPMIAYPLPAASRIHVRSALRGKVEVHMHDLQGRLLHRTTTDASQLDCEGVDVSQVPNGLYLLRVTQGSRIHTLRVSVQH